MEHQAHADEGHAHVEEEASSVLDGATYLVWHKVQWVVDRLTIYPVARWLLALCLFGFYVYRAVINQGKEGQGSRVGFHIISYFLGLFLLDKILGFISPKNEEDVMSTDSVLPTTQNDEFKPFRRAVKELDLW